MKSILFWSAIGIVALLGLRHLFSILTGWSQDGQLKPGQRLCHTTSFLLLIGSSVIAAIFRVWWPYILLVGVASEHLFRRFIIWSGNKHPFEEERQMNLKKFFKHTTNEKTNNKT